MEQYALYLRKSRADMDAEARGEGETLAKHRAALTLLFPHARGTRSAFLWFFTETCGMVSQGDSAFPFGEGAP